MVFEKDLKKKDISLYCPGCHIKLSAVNVFESKRITKKHPHFRKFPETFHDKNCEYIEFTEISDNVKSAKKQLNDFLNELVLDEPMLELEPEFKVNLSKNITQEEIETKINRANTNLRHKRLSRFLDDIIDRYKGKESDLLTIGKTKKPFSKWLKRIKYFKDGNNYIFYGDCRIKKYGKNYQIKFKDLVKEDNNLLSISLYINENLLNAYRYKKEFIANIESVIDKDVIITCYVYGVNFERKEIPSKIKTYIIDNIKMDNLKEDVIPKKKPYFVYDINIDNLKLIAFRHNMVDMI
ncbi:MAG: hypothetical protein ACYCT6_09410 [bacterium]